MHHQVILHLNVAQYLCDIDDFDNYFAEHAISYGLFYYVAKNCLSIDQYLLSENALDFL